MKAPEIRTCPICGKDFTAFVYNKAYCSDECRIKATTLGLNIKSFEDYCRENLDLDMELKTQPKRKCHDCGTPSNNYRCERCWHKKRGFGQTTAQYLGDAGMDTQTPYIFGK